MRVHAGKVGVLWQNMGVVIHFIMCQLLLNGWLCVCHKAYGTTAAIHVQFLYKHEHTTLWPRCFTTVWGALYANSWVTICCSSIKLLAVVHLEVGFGNSSVFLLCNSTTAHGWYITITEQRGMHPYSKSNKNNTIPYSGKFRGSKFSWIVIFVEISLWISLHVHTTHHVSVTASHWFTVTAKPLSNFLAIRYIQTQPLAAQCTID